MYQTEIERITEELYFIAASPATRRVRMQAELLSQTNVPVLITGESGSGKTTVARLIHSLSIRSSYPFMQVKCAMLTPDLLENELFGSESTLNGRQEAMPGKFEECSRGTVLLDEFEAIPGAVQRRLLKMLESEEFYRAGSHHPIRTDVRIIAATTEDLQLAAEEPKIQEELFYRLSVVELRVPSLRERVDEIPLLLGHLMNRLSRRYGVAAPRFSGSLLDACQHHSWPGNLRELENFAKRFLSHGDETAALLELHSSPAYGPAGRGNGGRAEDYRQSLGIHLSNQQPSDSPSLRSSEEKSEKRSPLKLLVRNAKGETERGAITDALEYTGWNRKAAARLLHVSYRALLYKIQEYRLAPPVESIRLPNSATMRQTK
jgi:two-component system, NtrC family, response regulator AtoC